MWHKLLRDAWFHLILLDADREIASEAHGKGCPACGGPLLVKLIAERAASGLPPAYVPKDVEPGASR